MLLFQALWLRKKKNPSLFVYSPYIMLFRVTFTVSHKCVQEFALFILSGEKSTSQLVLYTRNVIVGLTHAIRKRNQLRIVYCFQY